MLRSAVALSALTTLVLAITPRGLAQELTLQSQTSVEPQFGSRVQDWITLGHLAPFGASMVAVSPEWPADRTLIAIRSGRGAESGRLIRTTDGGEHWQAVGTLPAASIDDLVLAGPADQRALFVKTLKGLFRSTDLGSSWAQVLPTSNPDELIAITWSPDFEHDGIMLGLVAGALWRSRDFGVTWRQLNPGDGQVVQGVEFSPDFARDHRLFVAAAGGAFSLSPVEPGHPRADHEYSLGVLASTDAGESWIEQSAGLEVDGEPYLAVQTLAISPTFATDGTLFAIAWGPISDTQLRDRPATQQDHGLFVSHDRAASWTLLQPLGPAIVASREFIVPSPTFDVDGVALWATSASGVTPSGYSCGVARTADGGSSWNRVLAGETYDVCIGLKMFHVDGTTFAAVDKRGRRLWSADGGQTWSDSQLSGIGQFPVAVTLPNGDEALIAATPHTAGVVGLNTKTPATSGSLPCHESTQLGFDRAYRAHPEVPDLLGCPTAPEANVRIRLATRRLGDQVQQNYLVLGDSPVSYTAGPGGTSAFASTLNETDRERVLRDYAENERVVDGSIQSFEGGVMLYIPSADDPSGQIVVLSVVGLGQWRIYPDTPAD